MINFDDSARRKSTDLPQIRIPKRLMIMAAARPCWLVKSEPDCFSIHDLAASPHQTTCWSGVRNYQARNFMRDGMQPGDRVLFYHSSADPPAVAGTAVVVRGAYPDPTAWDPRDDHYDPKASPENPIWQMVDIRLDKIFEPSIPIGALRAIRELADMELLRKGSRLSVQRVTPREFEIVVALAVSSGPLAGKRRPAKKARPQTKATQKASAKRR